VQCHAFLHSTVLLTDPELSKNMAAACRQRIVSEQKNTYADRLQTILELIN
jgi:hypothetical protein